MPAPAVEIPVPELTEPEPVVAEEVEPAIPVEPEPESVTAEEPAELYEPEPFSTDEPEPEEEVLPEPVRYTPPVAAKTPVVMPEPRKPASPPPVARKEPAVEKIPDPNERFYEWLVYQVKMQWSEIERRNHLDLGHSYQLANALLDHFVSNAGVLEAHALNRRGNNSITARMVNTAIFALDIGHRMNLTPNELERLTVAALTHDFGMAMIPSSILTKTENLNNDEIELVRKHPMLVRELVRNGVGHDVDEELLEVIYRVHERINGKGYPDGQIGNQILLLARILAVANTFAAFSHPRHYRKTFIASEAIQEVKRLSGKELDAEAVTALIKELTPFPVDSFVILNNGEIGRVVAANKEAPLRPVVEVVFSASKKRLPYARKEDLRSATGTFITHPIQERDLPEPY